MALFLSYGFVPAPWTAYATMLKLGPGQVVILDAAGAERRRRPYWRAAKAAAEAAARPFAGNADDAKHALQALVDDAVALRLEADVKLGVFLSGGIDSTMVTAAARALRGPVRSFCIGFEEARLDESSHAEAVARALGTEHATLRVSEEECRAVVLALARIYDEPFADASQIPTVALCRAARREVTVSLSGDGGDEFFGGYARYARAADAWRKLETWPALVRSAAGVAASALGGSEFRPVRRARRGLQNVSHLDPQSLYRDHLTGWRPGDGLVAAERLKTLMDMPLADGPPSLEQRFMLRDAMTYLPDDLLVKIDRASMACGLEVRAPLLDHRIAEFAWSLPPDLVRGKALLREALYERVPRALVDRPKQGFEPPLDRWLREGLRDWVDDLLSPARLAQSGIVAPGIVAARWSAHRADKRNWGRALWPVIMLEAWLSERSASR